MHSFGAPVMVLDTPCPAALTSQTQVLAYAGEGLGFVSVNQGDVQHSAAHTASQVSVPQARQKLNRCAKTLQ